MEAIVKIMSSLRHPTTTFVNEDTFPLAVEAMPALKSIAASGFRGDKAFDDGFMSAASAAYDALTDAAIPDFDKLVANVTLEAVHRIDNLLQEDKEFAKRAISELNVGRFLKSKANDAFKAGALLAMATIAYADEFPPEDDDKDREVMKEKPLGEPTEPAEDPREPGPSIAEHHTDLGNTIMLKDALPVILTPSGKTYFNTELKPISIDGIIYIEITILFGIIPAADLFKVLETLKAKGVMNPMLGAEHRADGDHIAIKIFTLP